MEDEIPQKQDIIVNFILNMNIDICFFQEVAQYPNNKSIKTRIKEGNYVHELVSKLQEKGHQYYYIYDYSKTGYKIYDEGLAIISKTPLFNEKSYYVSEERHYNKWRTRMNVSCETQYQNQLIQLTSVHLGWTDKKEKFEDHFDKTSEYAKSKNLSIIAGDFNVSADSNEYQYFINQGWNDIYYNNESKYFHEATHRENIDIKEEPKRIDYILTNKDVRTIDRQIVFVEERVSDHYGVYVEIEV